MVALLTGGDWVLIVTFDCHSWGNYRCWRLLWWRFGVLDFFPPEIVGGKFTCGKWLIEGLLCLEFILAVPALGHFLRIAVMNSPPGFLNWRCQWAPMVELKLQEMSTRGQPFLTPASGPSSKESLGKVGFLGCELEWTVPDQTLKGWWLSASPP